jgi:site-specific DNA recombinase
MVKSTKSIKAAGYIRVSSKEQIEGESLSTQRQSIKSFAKQQDWELIDIYADEGISGGSVKERGALLECLHDAQNGKFHVLVIHRLSRFGRNARELLQNHHELEQVGIQLRSISEGIDFNSKYGKAMLGMLAIVAELEKDIIRETMLENRIARGKRGIPTSGKLPFARTFDKQTGKWSLDEEKAKLLRWAADDYLKGGSLKEIAMTLKTAHGQSINYAYLITLLSKRCGDSWTVQFKDEEAITYTIPRILDDQTIQKIRERLDHNKTNNRQDVRKYALTGHIRCDECGKSLFGSTQKKYGREYQYYNHRNDRYEPCTAFNSVPLNVIENAVFQTIFENIVDVPAFEKAIKDNLPDEKQVKSLQAQIKTSEKELKRISKELDKLVDLALSGTLKKSTIKSKEQALLHAKAKAAEELEANRDKLRSMPDLDKVKKEAEQIRREFLLHFQSAEHLAEMTFDEKKSLLHWLFDGKGPDGKPCGIYVAKKGRGANQKIDYFMYGRITGLKTVKGDDINYQYWDEDEGEKEEINYKTNISAPD